MAVFAVTIEYAVEKQIFRFEFLDDERVVLVDPVGVIRFKSFD